MPSVANAPEDATCRIDAALRRAALFEVSLNRTLVLELKRAVAGESTNPDAVTRLHHETGQPSCNRSDRFVTHLVGGTELGREPGTRDLGCFVMRSEPAEWFVARGGRR